MAHLPGLIIDLALILGVAGVISLLFKALKQPIVLGYILAGFVVGPNLPVFPTIIEIETIKIWADIGVIFLLFSLGLEFSFKKLVKIGGVSGITALIEVGATIFLGYWVGKLLGWAQMDCIFLGGILAIASTTIISRSFDELGVKRQKFAGIVLGVLVVEDLVAVVLMVVLSTVAVSKTFAGIEALGAIVKLVFFLILWFLAGIFILPTLIKKTARWINDETMLILSMALCFVMVLLATYAGFSAALGAFIMGSILAETVHAEKIEHLIKPVTNLFGAVFFVSVGMLINPHVIGQYFVPILIISLVLFLGKPLFVAAGAIIAGQPLKTAVRAGMSLSQIGEFSFIIAGLGVSLGVTGDFLYPVAVAVSVFTSFTTPYMIRFSDPVYELLNKILPQRWLAAINRYGFEPTAGAQNIWKDLLRSYAINVVINSVIIITLILIVTRYLTPLWQQNGWGTVITTIIAFACLSPFLWALSIKRHGSEAFTKLWLTKSYKGPLVLLQMVRVALSIFYIGFLLNRMFSPFVGVVIGISMLILMFIFSKRIQAFYTRIELSFLDNLNEKEKSSHGLAPWDSHLANFKLEAESACVGFTLLELGLREKFGVNIAMIERGDKIITAPERHERLYPYDKISVIGTDEQLAGFQQYLETGAPQRRFISTRQEVTLQQLVVGETSGLKNKSIRESRIREQTQGLVVGVERNDQRILNPESDFVFEAGDIIWIVGNTRRIQVINREQGDKNASISLT